MKTIYKTIIKFLGISLLIVISMISCEKYLDKAPQVNITEEEVFSKFISFQGFMENAYQCIMDHSMGMKGVSNWNFGDDIICGAQSIFCSPEFDRGNYWFWEDVNASPFYGNISTVNAGSDKGYWQNGWYGIRLSNIALSKVEKLTSSTQEERDLIAGQAYFFRGYFHFEIIRSWGGVPYIKSVFNPSDALKFPRLTYRQCADSITEDLQKAALLLPVSWEETTVGKISSGFNKGRLTRGAAYGYLGKNLLYAASPLMNGVTTGSYTYDAELCKQAAVAFNEVFKLATQFPQYIGLETWADYSKNFYSLTTDVPDGKEIIFSNPINSSKANGNHGGEQVLGAWGFAAYNAPSENYVENFGMANGLPLTAAGSGFNASDPWVNRDPRFYYSIIIDGERIIVNTENSDTYFQSYTNGRHRNATDTRSGYGNKKFKHITCNPYDRGWTTYYWEVPHMRLADIYLMYAEAVNEAYGPTTVPANIPGGMTAVAAVNIIRTRAGVPDVDARFFTKDLFREIIRQERAVELCMEGHRWYDIRRWYVAHLPLYREKYSLEFDAAHSYFTKKLWGTTVFEDKHYWLPFNVEQATLYAGFPQNPGW